MAITLADFQKIWASTSPLTPYSFSEANYKQGWNFIGSTPPARQMWDFLQKNNDEKMQYLANNYLPLSGGTLTGSLAFDNAGQDFIYKSKDTGSLSVYSGTAYNKGGHIALYGKDNGAANAGGFVLGAHNGTAGKYFEGRPDGTLTWGGNNVLTNATVGTVVSGTFTDAITLTSNTETVMGSISLPAGTWVVTGHIRYTTIIAGRQFIAVSGDSSSIGAENDGVVVHYSDTANNNTLSLTTTRIIVLSSTTTIYLLGYATTSCSSSSNHLKAVRIV